MAFQAGWITPQWPAPANVRAVCTTRVGGKSRGPYDSLNLGDHVGDSAEAVAFNRALFADAIQARPVFMQQVHGAHTIELADGTPDRVEADGCVTTSPRVACTIMVADCLPVLFAESEGRAVAAAHAGWRGLAGWAGDDILGSVWKRFRQLAALQDPAQTIVWLGPCIGAGAFEVGPEVKAAFVAQDPLAAALFTPHGAGKWMADLAGLARLRLRTMGVTLIYGNDGSREWCTFSNPSNFFSHRRDRVGGRFGASIWLA